MDTTNTTSFRRVLPNSRDNGAPRRAYLDTYTKRRGNLKDIPAYQPGVQAQEPQAAIPFVANVQPAVNTAEQITPVMQLAYAQPQPAVIAVPVQVSPQTVVAVESAPAEVPYNLASKVETLDTPSSHKSYLDTLTRRHNVAVAEAPALEETIFEPAVTESTQYLLQDSESEKRLEANLRALYEDSSLTSQISKNTQSASAAHIRTIVASALACGVLSVGIFSFMSGYGTSPVVAQPIGTPVIEVQAPSAQPAAGTPTVQSNNAAPAVDPTHPVRLVVSSIGVNAPVESLGTTPDGLIDVPKSYGVVGWYNKGSVPGKPGPAVLVGHFTGGNGGVFDKLQDLKDGDLITTTNGRGESFTYKVTARNEYDRDKVPMADLFKNSKDSKLQIITCAGKWQSKNYDKRLVVTAEIVK